MKESSLIGPKRRDGVGKRTTRKMERQEMDGIGGRGLEEGRWGEGKLGQRSPKSKKAEVTVGSARY